MGDSFQTIVDRDASADDAPRLAAEVRDWLVARRIIEQELTDCALGDSGHRPGPGHAAAVEEPDEETGVLSLQANGLQIEVGRTVFYTIGSELTCRACGAQFEPEDGWSEAVDDWYNGNDSAEFECPECGKPERLVEWSGEFPWGFGNLGFKFWNWPPLSGRFIQEVAEMLGHRIVLVRGDL
ncbi:hypothetical protein FJV41_42150 [Myxococcus llanfairpwllgwyngyllgogerychwyrndrobwllllantysiliogogogochensis]|uniref:Uncharacterized protein n=1 Tax=Myxococcus llanfairpwllgwyngyllgogerychwyrndrobwllllantysiliogogogochensis TaxID=2590453 RepID=A0A540WM43_9BACT|nr:zinc ribbon domain-containing protein [Myxococcus llanfairpwllgwyngyllgogerychwyrndrobwllllantysiliogogogochensis]TQF09917.1 hypothetical protein FJV41_42150 [Myxococcus llanfairpwllgwyngyllgogerychwyrndrobwllllantysiliogogogochensis]